MAHELSEDEREAIATAHEHGPEVCDCDAYAPEDGYSPDTICEGLAATFAAVERIIAARTRAVEQEHRDDLRQAEDWFRHVGQCEAKGTCPDSGFAIARCRRTVCDCFRYPNDKADDLSRSLDRAEAAEKKLVALDRVRQEAVEAALTEFVQWIAVERAYNGSDYLGQSLYNGGINGVLPEWAREFAAALATAKEEGR